MISLAVAPDTHAFWGCSEDRTVRLYDRRMWAPVGAPLKLRRQPMRLAWSSGQLFVADAAGLLHILDGSGASEPQVEVSWKLTPAPTKVCLSAAHFHWRLGLSNGVNQTFVIGRELISLLAGMVASRLLLGHAIPQSYPSTNPL